MQQSHPCVKRSRCRHTWSCATGSAPPGSVACWPVSGCWCWDRGWPSAVTATLAAAGKLGYERYDGDDERCDEGSDQECLECCGDPADGRERQPDGQDHAEDRPNYPAHVDQYAPGARRRRAALWPGGTLFPGFARAYADTKWMDAQEKKRLLWGVVAEFRGSPWHGRTCRSCWTTMTAACTPSSRAWRPPRRRHARRPPANNR
jgi:hypothetical protein